jgi:hypothetical protein
MGAARRVRWVVAVAVAVVVAGGCARDGNERSLGAAATAEPPAASVEASVPTSGSSPAGSPAPPTIVLADDGLGIAVFGTAADDTIAAITAVLGEPDEDSGWVDPLRVGACAGDEARFVAWGTLYLYFSDNSAFGDGERHFFGYSYGSERDLGAIPEGLATPEGIGLGTTVVFLRAAYHDVVIEAGEEGLLAPSFYVDDALSGRLTGTADDDLVTVIIGGDPCGVGM